MQEATGEKSKQLLQTLRRAFLAMVCLPHSDQTWYLCAAIHRIAKTLQISHTTPLWTSSALRVSSFRRGGERICRTTPTRSFLMLATCLCTANRYRHPQEIIYSICIVVVPGAHYQWSPPAFPSGRRVLNCPRLRTPSMSSSTLSSATSDEPTRFRPKPEHRSWERTRGCGKIKHSPTIAQFLVLGIRRTSTSTAHPQCMLSDASHTLYCAYELPMPCPPPRFSVSTSTSQSGTSRARSKRVSRPHAQHGIERYPEAQTRVASRGTHGVSSSAWFPMRKDSAGRSVVLVVSE